MAGHCVVLLRLVAGPPGVAAATASCKAAAVPLAVAVAVAGWDAPYTCTAVLPQADGGRGWVGVAVVLLRFGQPGWGSLRWWLGREAGSWVGGWRAGMGGGAGAVVFSRLMEGREALACPAALRQLGNATSA